MTVKRIFTFGFGHKHPVTGQSLAHHYVVIEGQTSKHCRCKMLNHFGNAWAFEYPDEEYAGVEKFNLTELSWKDFPPSSDLYRMDVHGNIAYGVRP